MGLHNKAAWRKGGRCIGQHRAEDQGLHMAAGMSGAA